MAVFTIGDIERLTHIKSATLRVWEKRYGLRATKRRDSNFRFYDEEDLRFFLQTSTLISIGFKISKIAAMTEGERKTHIEQSLPNGNNYEIFINQFVISVLELNEPLFQQTFQICLQLKGVESTIQEIVYPFLNRIGIFWLINTISAAQEHFVTNLIRQKLISEIDRLPIPNRNVPVKFLLFLPEGELHEIPLLFLNYMLRQRGYSSLYLGQNMPMHEIKTAIAYYNPSGICSILTASPLIGMEEFLQEMDRLAEKTSVTLAGRAFAEVSHSETSRIQFLSSPNQAIDWAKKLATESSSIQEVG